MTLRLSPAGLWLPDDAQSLVVPVKEGRLGPNLIINGHGEYGDKTGWTGGGYWVESGGLFGDACFRVDGTFVYSSAYIPINPLTDTLWGTMWGRRNEDTNRGLYGGMACYTANLVFIPFAGAWRFENTFCELYENYTGGTTIKVTPPANDVSGRPYLTLQINVSEDNSDLPIVSESKYRKVTAVTKNSDHWVLTLQSAFPTTYPQGTKCAFTQTDGNAFSYFLGYSVPPTTWTQRTGTISGQNDVYEAPKDYKFRFGTAYARFVFFTSGGSGEYNTFVDGIELRRVY